MVIFCSDHCFREQEKEIGQKVTTFVRKQLFRLILAKVRDYDYFIKFWFVLIDVRGLMVINMSFFANLEIMSLLHY